MKLWASHHIKVLLILERKLHLYLEEKQSSFCESEGQTGPFYWATQVFLFFFPRDLFGFSATETHAEYDMLAIVFTACNHTLLAGPIAHSASGDAKSVHSRTYRINRQSGYPVVFPPFGNYYLKCLAAL